MSDTPPDKMRRNRAIILTVCICGATGFVLPVLIGLFLDIREGVHGPLGLICTVIGIGFAVFIGPAMALIGGLIALLISKLPSRSANDGPAH